MTYGWGGLVPPLSSSKWPQVLDDAINHLEKCLIVSKHHQINTCLHFKFANGKITTGFHSDLKYKTDVADSVYFISLGESRPFKFKNIKTRKETTIILEHGMVMHVTTLCNQRYTHGRPEATTQKRSDSLTFRKV